LEHYYLAFSASGISSGTPGTTIKRGCSSQKEEHVELATPYTATHLAHIEKAPSSLFKFAFAGLATN
jgi:hypothetical protein